MMNKSLGCVGINVPVAETYPTRELAGHKLQDLPGGLFVMGSADFKDATPRWVYLNKYSIAPTAVNKKQYRPVIGESGLQDNPPDHSATGISYMDARKYLISKDDVLRLPTEAEWENAARGPAVNIREAMEEEAGKFSFDDFVAFAEGRYENFVFDALGEIFTNPSENRLFKELVERGLPFYGWRVYGTPSGSLNHKEAWYDQPLTNFVEWGPANAYGLKCMTGGVWEWVQDWYTARVAMLDTWNPTGPDVGGARVLRGGYWYCDDIRALRAAHRFNEAQHSESDMFGFRVAASQDS